MVHRRYLLPRVSASVERITTCPENGSSRNMQVKASSSRSWGTCQATRAPGARLVASSVCRTRRMVPAASMARIRSSTVGSSTPERRAISAKGSATKPWIRSSETSRIRELTGSVTSTGTPAGTSVCISLSIPASGLWS